MRHALLLIAGIYAAPLAAQAPDSTHQGTPTREFYTRVVVSPPDTVTLPPDTVEVPSKPDTVFVGTPLRAGRDTVVSGDTTRVTFWHEYVARMNDSVQVRVASPSITSGAGFGPSGFFAEPTPSPSKFTFLPNNNAVGATNALNTISKAKAAGVPVQLALPCASHSGDRDPVTGKFTKLGNCLRDSSGVAVFSRFRFDSTARATLTPTVVKAIQDGYKAGYIASIQIMDEPWVSGSDDGSGNVVGNTWGPKGTINRVRADSLCGFVKALVPGVPVGLSDHHTWDIGRGFRVCDFGQPQFSYRYVQTRDFASIAAWRDFYLARARQYGHGVSFSMNWINGGNQDRDGTWDCKDQGGIKGQRTPNCQMTPAQIVEVITANGDSTCGGHMAWRSDDARFSSPAFQDAIKQVLAVQAARKFKPCPVR